MVEKKHYFWIFAKILLSIKQKILEWEKLLRDKLSRKQKVANFMGFTFANENFEKFLLDKFSRNCPKFLIKSLQNGLI